MEPKIKAHQGTKPTEQVQTPPVETRQIPKAPPAPGVTPKDSTSLMREPLKPAPAPERVSTAADEADAKAKAMREALAKLDAKKAEEGSPESA